MKKILVFALLMVGVMSCTQTKTVEEPTVEEDTVEVPAEEDADAEVIDTSEEPDDMNIEALEEAAEEPDDMNVEAEAVQEPDDMNVAEEVENEEIEEPGDMNVEEVTEEADDMNADEMNESDEASPAISLSDLSGSGEGLNLKAKLVIDLGGGQTLELPVNIKVTLG